MFIDSVLFGRADSTSTSATSLSTSVSTGSTSTSTTTASSTSISASSSSSSSSSSPSSSASASSSSSSVSASSTQSSSTTSSASSTSAIASATASQSSSNSSSDDKEIGAIVGGVIGGLVVLTLLSVIFTVLRRRRRNAKKRPRGSVYLGNMDQSQLDTFLKQKPRSNVDSMHSSSSMPLLSLPHVGTTLQHDIATAEYTDVPAPNPYSDHEPSAAQGDDQNGPGVESESGHSIYLPSPYSQHGHDGNGDDVPPELPQPRLMTPSPRPESQFYAPIPVQAGDFSMKALEASASGSRSSTPMSLSMVHGKNGPNPSSPPLNEADAFHNDNQ